MNSELMEALDTLEREKNIKKSTLLEAIEQSLIQACKGHFGKADNVEVHIDPETGDFQVLANRTVVEDKDLLSDNVYRYNSSKGTIKMLEPKEEAKKLDRALPPVL